MSVSRFDQDSGLKTAQLESLGTVAQPLIAPVPITKPIVRNLVHSPPHRSSFLNVLMGFFFHLGHDFGRTLMFEVQRERRKEAEDGQRRQRAAAKRRS
jgi:hypothetical protein